MIKRSFQASVLVTGIVLSGVVAAPAFAQNFGLMPRGSCPKVSPSASYTAPPQVQQQQSTYNVASSAATPSRETPPRPRKRGFGSPF
jgi:hypothetical protein